MKYFLLLILIFTFFNVNAQVLTKEDSLNAGLTPANTASVFSGYGEAKYQYDFQQKQGVANLTRIVTFFGHRFNKNISFFSELELENAKVSSSGASTGEISLEQAFIKLNLNRSNYFTVGLFIPRVGIINENHLPTTYSGNDRPIVETIVLPATWREIGVGYYTSLRSIPGLNLSGAIVNGLNAAGFNNNRGITDGRYEGSNASARNLALTAAALYYVGNFRLQTSIYYGGSIGLTDRQADSLKLQTGMFGTPVIINEANAQYNNKGFHLKGLITQITIKDAAAINSAFANNTANTIFGAYAEVGYNILETFNMPTRKLTVFGRFERINMNAKPAENGLPNDINNQKHFITGIMYQPVWGVILKADYRFSSSGLPNSALQVNPFPRALPFYPNQHFINLGLGYSF